MVDQSSNIRTATYPVYIPVSHGVMEVSNNKESSQQPSTTGTRYLVPGAGVYTLVMIVRSLSQNDERRRPQLPVGHFSFHIPIYCHLAILFVLGYPLKI